MGFAEAAKAKNSKFTPPPRLEKGSRVSLRRRRTEDIEWAFKAEVGDVSEVLDLTGYYCVMRTADKIPAGPAELKEVETRVKRDFRNEELAKMCHDTAQAMYDEVQRGMSLSDVATRHGLAYDKPTPFTRAATLLQVNSDPAAMGAAFGLTRVGEVSKPVDHPTGCVMFELLERQVPDQALRREARLGLRNGLTE